MNCKQGDLAVIVSSIVPNSPNIGKIVRVVCPSNGNKTPIGGKYAEVDGKPWVRRTDEFLWFVESESNLHTMTVSGKAITFKYGPFADKNLRPLRDNDGEDETLTWAGKPRRSLPSVWRNTRSGV